MTLKMIGLAAFASLAFTAGTAAAQMQPIPNPPEKPKAHSMHHAKAHHAMTHHAKKHAAKKATTETKK
ncbi:MAG: hypothetical protein KGO51_08400 [Alphaproteobacteria bacterium]|nr:hypothetical protein [Alphaproteobacteria bacterium]